jgi:oligopeptide/dipeptide ABC transporter ATP-binding protein
MPASVASASDTSQAPELLRLEDLRVVFSDGGLLARLGRERSGLRAVDGVSLLVREREIVGIVGESGSGKTTLALAALRLTKAASGRVFFRDADITEAGRVRLRAARRDAVMIFQDPHSSLNPRMKVSALLTEPYRIHDIPKDQRYSVSELLRMVELPDRMASLYPHELSGGQARRVSIARPLALRPRLVVADEPTAGLDVSAASAILNLLASLRSQYGMAYLIITHALNIVGYLADRIAVMYLGRIVEQGPAEEIYDAPLHPYTQALMAAIPEMDPEQRKQEALVAGEIPSLRAPPPGCHFHPRCPYAVEQCRVDSPASEEAREGHWVACHRWREIRATRHAG